MASTEAASDPSVGFPRSSENKGVKPGLDTFRAFAFFAVYFFHLGGLRCGFLGVQAFFVLSGYLLTDILLRMKADLKARDYFLHFYGRRALRIFPLYYFYLAAAALWAWVAIRLFSDTTDRAYTLYLEQLPYALTYTYDFYHATAHFQLIPLLSHFWSLSVEEQFYLLWPLVLYVTPKNWLKLVLLGIAFAGPIIRLVEGQIVQLWDLPFLSSQPDLVIYVLPFSHLDAFAIGGMVSIFGARHRRRQFWTLAVGLPALAIAAQFVALGRVPWRSLGFPPYLGNAYMYVWGYSLLNYFFAISILCIAKGDFPKFIFNNSALRYLGKISYGLYVYHLPVLFAVGMYLRDSGLSKPRMYVEELLISLPLTILISAASYEFMESRFLRLKDVLFSKR